MSGNPVMIGPAHMESVPILATATPNPDLPSFDRPSYGLPGLDLPSFDRPGLDLPSFELPAAGSPTGGAAGDRLAPAAHRSGMHASDTLPAPIQGRVQYPELDEFINEIASLVTDGLMRESQARDKVLEAVWNTDLVEQTASRLLGSSSWHLRDDVVFEAQSWAVRAITGRVVGEYMQPGESATLLDFERVAAGASAVGYLREGIIRERSKFLRTIERRSHFGTGTELIDTTMLGASLNQQREQLGVGHRSALAQVVRRQAFEQAEVDRAAHVRDAYLDASRRAEKAERVLAQAAALQAYYEVPPAVRPLSAARRAAMYRVIVRDPRSAYHSMKNALRGAKNGLADMWRDYDEEDLRQILLSPRCVAAAEALALVAVAPLPWPGRDGLRRLRSHLRNLYRDHGLPGRDGVVLANAFVADECAAGPARLAVVSGDEDWADVAGQHIGPGGFLGPDPASVRERLIGAMAHHPMTQDSMTQDPMAQHPVAGTALTSRARETARAA
ncbi:hypothetical protein GCG21_08875 [Pseudactinotalea sp. HY160]|uniref:hypothetical protein n=1 Tax=Pseudactinotalea sp. HY160 TaxID=2654490 RepID=UPI001310C688|nr:hypothetical protein [Pseudactinotalea sp. HY160]MPV50117.1 hypothetical protein [Pseudactinotalea sp. HY160]